MANTRPENPSLGFVIPCYNEEAALPNVYFRRGFLLSDDGDKQGARKEFLAAADEAAKFAFAESRNEMLVRSHNALGIIAWQEATNSHWRKLGARSHREP